MQVKKQILVVLILSIFISCKIDNGKKQPPTFYNTIAGWDVEYVPIIEPYRAISIDKGSEWSIERPEVVGSFQVKSFGVSQNLIYGQGSANWFIFDTNSKLYAEYDTKKDLINALNSFSVTINDITECNSYFSSLAVGEKLYWFPKDGKTYPSYPSIKPDKVILINITEKEGEKIDFSFTKNLSLKKSKVYYFRVKYNKYTNDLYYLSFDNSQPLLAKDSLLIPIFNKKSEFEITLYTPYPVAQEKGIPEEKRFLKSKTIYIM